MKIFRYSLTVIILFFSWISPSLSQKNEIRGFVYDKNTGEPIIFTNVYLLGTTYGSATDINGFYSISKIKPGNYTLVCSYLGYDTLKTEISIGLNAVVSKNLYLTPSAIKLGEVEITDKKIESVTQVQISKIKITPSEILKLPTIGSTPDLAQFIQILPGVITSGDRGGQIYIRGGTPIQNKVLLDGMTIYNPFHSIGLYSVFDIDMIKNIDVYSGGFDAEYGDRISAIMDINTIDGNRTRISGKAGLSPFMARMILGGPIKKFRENEGNSNFLLTYRNSFLDKTAPYLYPYADSNGMPYSFNDLYGKITLNSADGSNLKIFGFNFNDKVNFKNLTVYDWNSFGAGTQFLLVPTGSFTIIDGHLSYSYYRINQTESDNKPRYSSIGGFEGGMKFSYYFGKDLLRFGFDLSGFQTELQYYNSAGRKIYDQNNTTNISGFIKYKKIYKNLIILPSFRLQYYASLQETSFEPRIGIKYNITETLRFKFAAGRYSQNFISSFSDRDVVNFFYGFLSAPDDIPNYFDGKKVTTRLQMATHTIAGTEIDLNESSSINIEGYYKNFDQLTNINRNKIFDNTPEYQHKPEYQRVDFIIENGEAYGIDFLYTYDKKPFYLWIVYGLSYVNRYDGIVTYTPHWDRRNNVQIFGNYILGDKNPFEISVRWNFGSGFPFTQTQGFYELLDFSGGINEDYTKTNGTLGILYAETNQGRLPSYHRLDISLKKTWKTENHSIEANVSVANVYNRHNIFYFDRITAKRVDQLPILPSAGLTWSF
ncbi:MAG TPA: carboxypeptidase-like regulatory domain-containing protein [Bacteroidia bacterium]|nr:carboxypeptidase-like regulatory domain-containing protein [Bacteroidia bacterium]HRS59474.1 carboxypeptidase-like regulatory domain-containing protein [Bacteroidia bacterium]HRU67766.1 carboxypeptidase-like regulatory domain-containing protein [Bacteroidia bacterium]